MKADIKKLWINRLESGEISQTVGTLGRKTGERCCLGVLCDLAVEAGVIALPVVDNNWVREGEKLLFGDTYDSAILPLSVREWAGMFTDNGRYDEFGEVQDREDESDGDCLSADNDRGKSFREIAKIVREKF